MPKHSCHVQSEYLRCNGWRRVALHCADTDYPLEHAYATCRPDRTRDGYYEAFALDMVRHLEHRTLPGRRATCPVDSANRVVEGIVGVGWCRWKDGEYGPLVIKTDTGHDALNGDPPQSSVIDPLAALRIVLLFLNAMKSLPEYGGDPRGAGKLVPIESLVEWARHNGVDQTRCDDAVDDGLDDRFIREYGRGKMRMGLSRLTGARREMFGEVYYITARGEAFIHSPEGRAAAESAGNTEGPPKTITTATKRADRGDDRSTIDRPTAPCKTADEAVCFIGREWATHKELAESMATVQSTIRNRIAKGRKSGKIHSDDIRRIPLAGQNSAKIEYRIKGVWEHIQPSCGRV